VNTLFATTAVIEIGAGLALLCVPSAAAALLLGTPLEAPAAFTVARVGGAGLLTLGVACWLARSDAQSPAARGLVTAMVIYNLGVALILGAAGIQSQPVGIVLWPAVVLHVAMTIWCVMSLLKWESKETKVLRH
jgi:quinol-cytochrome oxidoreductase complex cytochrome b subunit